MKRTSIALALVASAGFSAGALAQAKVQYVPHNYYWVGPYAASGSGIAGGEASRCDERQCNAGAFHECVS